MESFSFESHDVVGIVTASVEKVESIAILNDIDILYDPPNSVEISCDKDKLLRAIINVISNSLKYTKDYVSIEVENLENHVCVKVADNGAGFNKSKLDKLFLSTTGESVDGNGIGLLIVHEIVQKHGGIIEVLNKQEGGAEVTIKLPK